MPALPCLQRHRLRYMNIVLMAASLIHLRIILHKLVRWGDYNIKKRNCLGGFGSDQEFITERVCNSHMVSTPAIRIG